MQMRLEVDNEEYIIECGMNPTTYEDIIVRDIEEEFIGVVSISHVAKMVYRTIYGRTSIEFEGDYSEFADKTTEEIARWIIAQRPTLAS